MANDNVRPEITDAELESWCQAHNCRDVDGGPAGIGIQARDRLIRRLIDEVRRLRARLGD